MPYFVGPNDGQPVFPFRPVHLLAREKALRGHVDRKSRRPLQLMSVYQIISIRRVGLGDIAIKRGLFCRHGGGKSQEQEKWTHNFHD